MQYSISFTITQNSASVKNTAERFSFLFYSSRFSSLFCAECHIALLSNSHIFHRKSLRKIAKDEDLKTEDVVLISVDVLNADIYSSLNDHSRSLHVFITRCNLRRACLLRNRNEDFHASSKTKHE